MKNYDAIAEALCKPYPDVANFSVLEVGSDVTGGLLKSMAPRVKQITGINIVGTPAIVAPNAERKFGDVRDTDFASDSFDLIVSFAVFEHVRDMPEALAEMYRILKPGGELTTSFGPVWSCMWGHHVWVPGPTGVIFPKPPHMPPWCHLLMTPETLEKALVGKLSDETRRKAVKFVFESEDQNRIFHDAYLKMIEDSDFEVVALRSNRNHPLEAAHLGPDGAANEALKDLERRFGPGD